MDPVTAVGLAATVAQLINVTAKAIQYLNDVKDAPKDRARLAREAIGLLALLADLRCRVEEARPTDPWFAGVCSLGVEGGALEQFKNAMDQLARKLKPERGVRKFGKALLWALDKSEISSILSEIERLKTLVSLSLEKDHFALLQAIKSDSTEVARGFADQKSREIIAWISPLNFSVRQTDLLGRHQEGTGGWMLEDGTFKDWLNGASRILWCPGLPGAGKTTLTSIVVDYLERAFGREDAAIAYIYCSYKEQEDQTATNLISSLVQQLVRRSSTIPDEVAMLYNRHVQKQTRPTLSEWSTLLESVVCCFSKVFMVIDALDECPEKKGNRNCFLAEIRRLQSNARVHLLVTSRHISSIEYEFQEAACMEIRAIDKDIREYVDSRIRMEPRLARYIKADPSLQETISGAVVEKAQGMFLLAQLYMDSLAKKYNRKQVRDTLRNLPEDLKDVYDDAMDRIRSQDKDDSKLAKQVLSWISYALRPLSVREIQHALATYPGAADLDEEALPDEDILVSVCAGIVTIDQESRIIRLVHYTAQEYFDRTRMSQFPTAQTEIALACLTYLSFDAFAEGSCRSDREMEARLDKYPLLEYAALYWGDHACGDPEVSIKDIALKFLGQNPKLDCSNQVVRLPKVRLIAGYSQWFLPKGVTGLQVAASFNLVEIVRLLLEKGADVNAGDSLKGTALHHAASNGCEAVVRLLLEKGARVNAIDEYRRTPLHLAAGNGHEKVAQQLLEMGAEVHEQNAFNETALYLAVGKGCQTVVRLLIEKGALVNALGDHRATALHVAARHGQETAVRMLLEEGAKVNAIDEYKRTPLHLAARYGDETVVRLLLEKGAWANAKDKSGETALNYAARNGHVGVSQRLLEMGAEINTIDRYGRTALSIAARYKHEAVVRLLLDKGADAKAMGELEGTALYQAVMRHLQTLNQPSRPPNPPLPQ